MEVHLQKWADYDKNYIRGLHANPKKEHDKAHANLESVMDKF